jgi:hypothetical protein
MTEMDDNRLCDDCKALVGAGRYVQAHSGLQLLSSQSFSSAAGSADEAYYQCTVCGKKWLHETGNMGFGWQ